MRNKGISPMVATVLMVAFTVSVAIIVLNWYQTFFTSTGEKVGNQTAQKIDCSYGAISFRNICLREENLTGIIENNGNIDLSDIELQIAYKNGSVLKYNYTELGFENNIFLVGNRKYINVYIGNLENVSIIVVKTNCPKVDDQIEATRIEIC